MGSAFDTARGERRISPNAARAAPHQTLAIGLGKTHYIDRPDLLGSRGRDGVSDG